MGGPDNPARLWDAESGQLVTTLNGRAATVVFAAFASDGTRFIIVSKDGAGEIWDTSGRLLVTLTTFVVSAAFSPDGGRVVTVAGDYTAKEWEAASGKLLVTIEAHSGAFSAAVFSPDGRHIVTSNANRTTEIWDAGSGQLLVTLRNQVSPAFSPDGSRLVTTSVGDDHSAIVWDVASGRLVAALKGHTAVVNSAAFSPDGNRVVTASDDKTAKIWDLGAVISPEQPRLVSQANSEPSIIGDWVVIAAEKNGKFTHCLATRLSERGTETIFATSEYMSFAAIYKGVSLKAGKRHTFQLDIGNEQFDITTDKIGRGDEEKIGFPIKDAIAELLPKASTFALRIEGKTLKVPFQDGAPLIEKLQSCVAENAGR
jgi:dipeptidyl aminopeptidase/acylaminoacyl peptidase